jgi:hypothetical protein
MKIYFYRIVDADVQQKMYPFFMLLVTVTVRLPYGLLGLSKSIFQLPLGTGIPLYPTRFHFFLIFCCFLLLMLPHLHDAGESTPKNDTGIVNSSSQRQYIICY